MNKRNLILFAVTCSMFFTSCENKKTQQEINIIPRPVKTELTKESFKLTSETEINLIHEVEGITPAINFFIKLTESSLGKPLTTTQGATKSNAINILIDTTLQQEAYELDINTKSIDIKAGSPQSVFYAFQSLRQMMPAEIEKGTPLSSIELQGVRIQDKPRFEHRGMMLDVCRHIFSIDEIKTFIDMLALHKLNRFHWHLTDDQGWRIEIKKYPLLMEKGAYREETVLGRNSGEYDGKPYGGFYTQEEVKDVVKYAADRYITVIPEIELPGHACAALTAYPSLGCSGGPYKVEGEWGVFEDVFCAGNEKTIEFLQDVLDEVVPLFPSEYIHIGGDECPRVAWENCPKCQALMKKGKMKNESELQSYFIHRIEPYLNAKGKKIIGWDEILEGGVTQTATVMSWRGTKGGIAASKLGNHVIMAPNSHLYFDYYQSLDQSKEPFSIGGFINMAKVYGFDPTSGLTPEEGNMVIGVQANLWTEYIPEFQQVQYMTLPRMAALSEIAWSPVENKNYENFAGRAIELTDRYAALGYNFARHILSVDGELTSDNQEKCLVLKLTPKTESIEIRYTTDGTTPSVNSFLYDTPLKINSDSQIKAQLFKDGKALGEEYNRKIRMSKAAFKPTELLTTASEAYPGKGGQTFTDGLNGTANFHDGLWLGSSIDDIAALIDFGESTAYSEVAIGCLNYPADWICAPKSIAVYASEDGNNFQEVARMDNIPEREEMQKEGIKGLTLNIENGKSRYLKIVVEKVKLIPAGYPAAGQPAYVFVDEMGIF